MPLPQAVLPSECFSLTSMKIELRLYASLGRYLPEEKEGNSCTVEAEPGTTIRELFF